MSTVSLVTVGALLLAGLVAGMVQLSTHDNGPMGRHRGPRSAASSVAPASGAGGNLWPPERVWQAEVVVDPLTGEALDALTPQELALGRLDHGAESFAANPGMFDEYEGGHREETARQFWNASFDWYIAHINQRFDALVEGLPTTGEDPFDPQYWPPVSAVPTSGLPGIAGEPVTLERLATFSPDATIQIIEERNAEPTVFSWTTREYALVGASGAVQVAQHGNVTLVRERPKRGAARHRRGN